MASEDVLERATKAQKMIPRAIDVFEQAVFIGSVVDDLAAEVRAQRARAERAERDKDELLEVRQSLHAAMMLEWRGVEHGCECLACGGAGVRSYPSTSTWRGGIGGQAFTTDVCDKCWGSGDRNNAWPSHRAPVEACKGGRDHG